jgi:hypothetical protein
VLTAADVDLVTRHLDGPRPSGPALLQGKIAGVPVKLGLPGDGGGILVVQTAYADELTRRLGW